MVIFNLTMSSGKSTIWKIRSHFIVAFLLTFNLVTGNIQKLRLEQSVSCYTSCKTCTNSGSASNNNCDTCADSYYPLVDNTSQCYPADATVSGYYYDSGNGDFEHCIANCIKCSDGYTCETCDNSYTLTTSKQCAGTQNPSVSCYTSCSLCSQTGTAGDNQCLQCAQKYYPLSDKPTNCDNSLPYNYVFNQTTNFYDLCPITSSSSSLNNLQVNYLSPDTLSIDPSASSSKNSFVIGVSEYLSSQYPLTDVTGVYITQSTNKIDLTIDLIQCSEIYVSYVGQLSLGQYDVYIIDGNSQNIQSTFKLTVNQLAFWENLTSNHQYVFKLAQHSQYINPQLSTAPTSSFLLYHNQVYDMEVAENIAADNNIAVVDIGDCDRVLRELYQLPADQNLFVAVITYKNTGEWQSKVNYQVFDSRGNQLDTSNCSPQSRITVKIPLVYQDERILENLDTARTLQKDWGVNMYNPLDPFYTDNCFVYYIHQADVPLAIRRSDYYPNVTISCSYGCINTGVDLNIDYALCACAAEAAGAVSEKTQDVVLAYMNTNVLNAFSCNRNMFSHLRNNYGFMFTLAIFWFGIIVPALIFFLYKPKVA